MNKILKLAGVMFLITLIITLVGKFALGPEFVLGKLSMISSTVLPLILMIVLGRMFLRSGEGMLSYGEALKDLFIAALIAGVLGLVVGILLYQNDGEMKTAYRDYSISMAQWGLETGLGFDGKSEAEIQIAKEELKAEMVADTKTFDESYPFQFSVLPMNLITVIVMYLIFALIAAIFVKEKGSSA